MKALLVLFFITLCCAASIRQRSKKDSVKLDRLERFLHQLIKKQKSRELIRSASDGTSSTVHLPNRRLSIRPKDSGSDPLDIQMNESVDKTSEDNDSVANSNESKINTFPSDDYDSEGQLSDTMYSEDYSEEDADEDMDDMYDVYDYDNPSDYDSLGLDSFETSVEAFGSFSENDYYYNEVDKRSQLEKTRLNNLQTHGRHFEPLPKILVGNRQRSMKNGRDEIAGSNFDDTLEYVDRYDTLFDDTDNVDDNDYSQANTSDSRTNRNIRDRRLNKMERALQTKDNLDYNVDIIAGDSFDLGEEHASDYNGVDDNDPAGLETSKKSTINNHTKLKSSERRQFNNYNGHDYTGTDEYYYNDEALDSTDSSNPTTGDAETHNMTDNTALDTNGNDTPHDLETAGINGEYDGDDFYDYNENNDDDLSNNTYSLKQILFHNKWQPKELKHSIKKEVPDSKLVVEDYDSTDSPNLEANAYEMSKRKTTEQRLLEHLKDPIDDDEDESFGEIEETESFDYPQVETKDFEDDIYSDDFEIDSDIDTIDTGDEDKSSTEHGNRFYGRNDQVPDNVLTPDALHSIVFRSIVAARKRSSNTNSSDTGLFGYEEIRDRIKMPESDFLENLIKGGFIERKNETIKFQNTIFNFSSCLKKAYNSIQKVAKVIGDPDSLALIYTRKFSAQLLQRRMNCDGALVDRFLIRLIDDDMSDFIKSGSEELHKHLLSSWKPLSTMPYQAGYYATLKMAMDINDYYYTQSLIYMLSVGYTDVTEFSKRIYRLLKNKFRERQLSNTSITFEDLSLMLSDAFDGSQVACPYRSKTLQEHAFAAKSLVQYHRMQGEEGVTLKLKRIWFDSLFALFLIPSSSSLTSFTHYLEHFDVTSATTHVHRYGETVVSRLAGLWELVQKDNILSRLTQFYRTGEEAEAWASVVSHVSSSY